MASSHQKDVGRGLEQILPQSPQEKANTANSLPLDFWLLPLTDTVSFGYWKPPSLGTC
jgi:hypothetical protein